MEVDVTGIPVPQGSKRVFNGRLVDVNHSKLRDWRALVATSMPSQTPITGPVYVRLDFYMPRPKGHYGTGRNASALRPSAPSVPNTKPDIDKLVRACLDALTGMAFRDDSQVAALSARKFYADERQPGVHIEIEER
jgi:Holliday junction resolvase RusA-like endonuclease